MEPVSRQRWIDRGAVLVLYVGVSALVFSLWLFHGRQFNTFTPAKAERMTYGGAARPFSSRVLLPWTVRALVAPVPAEVRSDWTASMMETRPRVDNLVRYLDTTPSFAVELGLIVVLDYAALLGFMFTLSALFSALYRAPPWVGRVAPVVAVLILPLFFREGTHFVYDLPALFFFTAALYLIHTDRWNGLLVVLAAGTLNKETMVFALLVFALVQRDRMPRGRFWAYLGVQTAVVLVCRVLAVALSSPAGPVGERNDYLRDYLGINAIDFWSDPFLLDYRSVAAILFFVLLVGWKFSARPQFLRRASLVAVPFFAAFFWGSRWGEIRALYELFPISFLLGYPTLAQGLGADVLPGEDPNAPPSVLPAGLIAPALAVVLGLGSLYVVWAVLSNFLTRPVT